MIWRAPQAVAREVASGTRASARSLWQRLSFWCGSASAGARRRGGGHSYRYAAVVRLAAAARERGMDRDLAVRRALDVTAAEDEGFDARLAKRLEETLADPTPGIPLEEFLRAHDI